VGVSKTDIFTDRQNQLSILAKAIGHPARVAIIEFLLKQQTCICKDIVGEVPLSQPTISQHLRELKKVGLIKGTIEGNTVCYCLDKKGFEDLHNYTSMVLDSLNKPNSECC
jgi:DNA-binding transcriptional ArsR family regulator